MSSRGLAAGRRSRSTRAARATTQRSTASSRANRGRDSEGSRIRVNINQAPARKWTEVMRPPAAGVRFLIPTWVAVENLTPEERKDYEKTLEKEKERKREEARKLELAKMAEGTPTEAANRATPNQAEGPEGEPNPMVDQGNEQGDSQTEAGNKTAADNNTESENPGNASLEQQPPPVNDTTDGASEAPPAKKARLDTAEVDGSTAADSCDLPAVETDAGNADVDTEMKDAEMKQPVPPSEPPLTSEPQINQAVTTRNDAINSNVGDDADIKDAEPLTDPPASDLQTNQEEPADGEKKDQQQDDPAAGESRAALEETATI